jgi:hypothetical protein
VSGFVYIWFDRFRKLYYIGAHWGSPDDGYICSSPWMSRAYKHRPHDFKRRIIKIITTTRKEMFEEEQRFLKMIKNEDKKYYYNINFTGTDEHWMNDSIKSKSTRQKMSASHKGKPAPNKGKTNMVNISTALKARKRIPCASCGLDIVPNLYARFHGPKCIFTQEQVFKIKEMHQEGASLRAIARDFNTDHQRIKKLVA